MTVWDLTKIKPEDVPQIREAVKGHDTAKLIEIHDRLGLSNVQYCCAGPQYMSEPQEWFEFYLNKLDG